MKCLGCKVFREKIGYEMFIQNRQVTKCFGYEMFKLQNVRLRDRCYELWLRNVRYEMSKL